MSASCNLSEEEPVPAPPSTVLVVEDEIMVRAVVAAYLRDCGFDVVEAANADEGVRVLEAGVRVDIVFSDVNMPGSIDGFGLAQWLRQERPGLKIVLTSGGLWTAREMSDLCEDGLLLAKPYDHARLARRLRELLAR